MPLSVLSSWWAHEYGWAPNAVRQFCRVLAHRSLIDAYLADRDVVLLHDVFRAYLRHLVGQDWIDLHRSLVASYRRLTGTGWAELGTEHSYIWHQLPHHLHEAQLADELAGLITSPDYVVKKAARFGHEFLAIDRVALGREIRPDTEPWHTARILTSSSRLLHGLTSERDIAATLLAACRRAAADPVVIGRLRDTVGAHGLDTLWATTEAGGDGVTPVP